MHYGSFVVVAIGPVYVAMGDLFFRRAANIDHLNGEIQTHTGKRMVTVDRDIVPFDRDDRNDQWLSLGRRGVELHAGLERLDGAKQFSRNYLLQRFVAHSISFLGSNGDH